MRRSCLAVCAALTLPLAACQGADKTAETSSSAQTVTVTGKAFYLERIALPPGAMLHVKVVDMQHADAALGAVAADDFNASLVPIPFELEVKGSKIEPNRQYGVSASLRDVDDKLMFSTAAPVAVDLRAPAPLEIRLVRATGK
ncbi:YbaY family lipoprotein [Nannocystis pusilla]|uniref:YbaY family lipoprotein n=1 Tax=Nannocystis pusilla TaxID=889268 RepID=A0A9X3F3Q4_9BACT|nr:YbaY family lipoprotein [Nannocystis pusilla]MCY1010866.1 YbaY family lipoprotein [Nannocystis pusilla]